MDQLSQSVSEPVALSATGSSRRTPVMLHLLVGATVVAGLACLLVTLLHQVRDPGWAAVGLQCYLLAVFMLLSELWAIPVPRGDDTTDALTTSSTFATALVLIGPLGLALVVQAIAVAVDDRRHHRPARIMLFNIGQYLITLTATRIVYSIVSGEDVFALTTPFTRHHILAALVAGLTYFIVNNGLVALVVALASGLTLGEVLSDDVRFQFATSSILLGLAPVTAHAASLSVFMLPLLLLPLFGVLSNARISLNRHHDSLHDTLTGLPNREYFRRRTDKTLLTSAAAGQELAVMLFDLDHFKEINDTLGHQAGDEVIRQTAKRLVSCMPSDVMVARLGGDEFAAVVPHVTDRAALIALAGRVSDRLRDPLDIAGVRMVVRASIGIAMFPDHADSVTTLLKHADTALYRAKANRGEVQVYRPDIESQTVESLGLLGDLHQALDHGQLTLEFQPQLDARTGRVLGVEALCRWLHPRHGLVGPDTFIPLAENSGLIGPMSRWVLESSLAALARWREAGHHLTMAVNISARVLTDLDLPDQVEEMLRRYNVPASRLTIEITENTIMADPKRVAEVLGRLRLLGVRLAVDDYGTGFSSLSHLRRISVDELKIDRSFVLQMRTDDHSAVIVKSTVDMAHGLGLIVTAEGVEDLPTLNALRALGIDRIQGFHYSRPLTPLALDSWLDAGRVPEPTEQASSSVRSAS